MSGGVAAYAPDFITFTGVDRWTDLDRTLSLSSRYPIEWGILFSPQRQGVKPRYPALGIVEHITDRLAGNMATTAAHLCGGYARDVISGKPPDILSYLLGRFDRFQINTADKRVVPRAVGDVARKLGGTAVLQCRDSFPDLHDDVEWLFDASGGRGIVPSSWPLPPMQKRITVGYAGGLGPDTVAEALTAIAPRHDADHPYWIDMESAIRTDDRLDLDKCEAVCRAVYDSASPTPAAKP